MYLKHIKISIIVLISIVLLQSCKDNSVVTTPVTPSQNPNSPQLVSPGNEATITELSAVLDWNEYTSAISYRIQVSLDANFAGTILFDSNGITATQYQLSANFQTTGIYYYWRVIANISGGTSSWSSTWRYRIVEAPPPAPTLQLPANGAIDVSFLTLFDWTDTQNTQFYRLQISTASNFSSILYDTNRISVSTLQCPEKILNTGTQYFWRVNASNSNGLSSSPWSTAFSFTTVSGPMPKSISGVITFADTNFVANSEETYRIAAYNNWPPFTFSLFASDSISIHKVGNIYQANYILKHLPDDNYIIALYFFSTPNFLELPILGIYGCDTVHTQYSTCPQNPSRVIIQNSNGMDNINFISWADTTKRIY